MEVIVAIAIMIISFVAKAYPPFGRFAEQLLNQTWTNNLPDPHTLSQILMTRLITYDDYAKQMSKLGFDDNFAMHYSKLATQWLSGIDYVSAWRRELISEDELNTSLRALRYTDEDIELIKKVSEYFPTPSDLVRFAVREVYSPEIAQRFGLFEDLPEDFLKESYKAGLSEEQAKNYWASHWELPSAQMGFEMLHRRIIDEEDLKLLLRALDVMPFWREKLIQLSYNPLTRVDVRRMYSLGVLDRDDVYNAYLDEGYSPENAEKLTNFTILYENEEMTGMTRSTIIDAFKDGIITLVELQNYLAKLNYPSEVVEFYVNQAQYEKALLDIKAYADDLAEQFQAGILTLDELRSELHQLDIPASFIDTIINRVIRQKAKRVKPPSLNDAREFLRVGIINDTEFTSILRRLGYRDEDIQRYLMYESFSKDTTKKRYLNVNTYVRWVSQNIMTYDDFVKTLTEMGYTEEDITKLLREVSF